MLKGVPATVVNLSKVSNNGDHNLKGPTWWMDEKLFE
jgi:hypothetical protein